MSSTNKVLKLSVVCLSGMLAVFGLLELIQNAFVSSFSGGIFGRGFICGIISLFAGFLGAFRCFQFIHHLNYVKCFVVAALISSGIALWSQRSAFGFASEIEACASFSSDPSITCNSELGYECFGGSYYYAAAINCLDRFHLTDDDCACIATEHEECYNFSGIQDCSQLYAQLPKSIKASYYLAVLIFATSSALLIIIAMSIKNFTSNISSEGYTVVAPAQVFDAEDEGL